MDQKIVSFYCPNCSKQGKRNEARLRDSGGYMCASCGSTYSSFESAMKVVETTTE